MSAGATSPVEVALAAGDACRPAGLEALDGDRREVDRERHYLAGSWRRTSRKAMPSCCAAWGVASWTTPASSLSPASATPGSREAGVGTHLVRHTSAERDTAVDGGSGSRPLRTPERGGRRGARLWLSLAARWGVERVGPLGVSEQDMVTVSESRWPSAWAWVASGGFWGGGAHSRSPRCASDAAARRLCGVALRRPGRESDAPTGIEDPGAAPAWCDRRGRQWIRDSLGRLSG